MRGGLNRACCETSFRIPSSDVFLGVELCPTGPISRRLVGGGSLDQVPVIGGDANAVPKRAVPAKRFTPSTPESS